MITIGAAQFTATSDVSHNLAEIERFVADASRKGVDLVCYHELATTIYFCFRNDPQFRAWAQPEDSEAVHRIRSAAQANRIGVVFPFYELDPQGRLFNTAMVIDEHGNIVGKYRKMSIPAMLQTVDPSETPGDEQYYFTPGDLGFPVFSVRGVTIGILICYDRHFPEAARILGLRGAEVVFVPTATYRRWIQRVWEAELIGHAIANGFYVVGVNRVGVEDGGAPNRSYFGSSLVIDPTGEVIARAGDSSPQLLTAEISPQRVHDTRNLWGFFRTRRADAYAPLADQSDEPERRVITAAPQGQ